MPKYDAVRHDPPAPVAQVILRDSGTGATVTRRHFAQLGHAHLADDVAGFPRATGGDVSMAPQGC